MPSGSCVKNSRGTHYKVIQSDVQARDEIIECLVVAGAANGGANNINTSNKQERECFFFFHSSPLQHRERTTGSILHRAASEIDNAAVIAGV